MISTGAFIASFFHLFPTIDHLLPWQITNDLTSILQQRLDQLDDSYYNSDGVAIHKSATVEKGAVVKAPAIIGENCFVGSNAYLRGGVYLDGHVKIGTGCEIKTSILFCKTAIAHFNFIGDSIIGSEVNFEAGAVTANHHNERSNKIISVIYNSTIIDTGIVKFGALVGDHCKIGANAVLSPGTILQPASVVKRLELIEQISL